MDSPNWDIPDIYAEEEDASIIIPFHLAVMPFIEPNNSNLDENAPDFGADDSSWLSPHYSDQHLDKDHLFDFPGQLIIEVEKIPEHLMWKEACGALRHFGTFAILPLDVQIIILDYCGPTSLIRLSQVNENGRLIGKQDRFWERLFIADFIYADHTTSEGISWKRKYQEAYNYCISAIVISTGTLSSIYRYDHSVMTLSSVPTRRWVWNPKQSNLFLPSMKYAMWRADCNQLISGQRRYTFFPNSGRLSSLDSPITGVITTDATFPPVQRIYTWTAFGPMANYMVRGTLPMPLLMAIIFNIE
jgi:hypothetical protein